MEAQFVEVLDRESAALAEVTDRATLDRWRGRVVREIVAPQSHYAWALRQTGDTAGRADFVGRWRAMIQDAIDRLLRTAAATENPSAGPAAGSVAGRRGVDPHESAVLILAALHGGTALSQLTQDPWPLNAALDLAMAPFSTCGATKGDGTA